MNKNGRKGPVNSKTTLFSLCKNTSKNKEYPENKKVFFTKTKMQAYLFDRKIVYKQRYPGACQDRNDHDNTFPVHFLVA